MFNKIRFNIEVILFAAVFISIFGVGTVFGQPPSPPHRVWGDVTYEDGSPAAHVTINFVNDAGEVVASDLTNENGYYDTDLPPGLDNNISEPEDKTLDIYVGDWNSGEVLNWETGGSEGINITGAPMKEPTVVTKDASNIGANSATLESSIGYGAYDSVDIRFQYRIEGESNWSNTPWETGYTESSYSYGLTELSSDTAYEFRVHIAYDGLENYGDIGTFTTLKVEPTVTTDGVDDVGENSAALNMTYDFKDYGSGEVRFEWRESGGSWNSTPWVDRSGTGSYSKSITDLSSGTNYEFRAQISYDNRDKEGSILTFSTESPANRTPTAEFSYSPSEPEPNETVYFDASASFDNDGEIVRYDWTFGDGTSGSGENVTHSYDSVGDYTVTLVVEDNAGAINSASKVVSVESPGPANEPPSADFSYSPSSPNSGETVNFDAAASWDPDGSIASYEWSFGDGSTATGATVSHSYASAGDYTVELTVTDDNGATDSETKTVTVSEAPVNQPPNAKAGGPYSVDEGSTVSLDGTGSSDNDGSVESYSWEITDGPGSLEDADTAEPTYLAPDDVDADTDVTVELTATDDDGATDSDTATITVKDVPEGGFPWGITAAIIVIIIVVIAAVWYWKTRMGISGEGRGP